MKTWRNTTFYIIAYILIFTIAGLISCKSDKDDLLFKKFYVKTNTFIESLSGIEAVSLGSNYTMILRKDGTVWADGNCYNDISVNTQIYYENDFDVFLQAVDEKGFINNAIAIAAGESHCLILKKDGTVWAVGTNIYGEFGNGTAGKAEGGTKFVQARDSIGFINNAVAIAAGVNHSLVLRKDGTVWVAGYNLYDSSVADFNDRYRKDKVFIPAKDILGKNLRNAKAISAGSQHSLVLKQDGTVWSGGRNISGQLGNGISSEGKHKSFFAQAKDSSGFIDNAIAITAGDSHSLILKNDGTVWGTGKNEDGQLGNGSFGKGQNEKVFIQVKDSNSLISDAMAISAGKGHSLILKKDGTVWFSGIKVNDKTNNKKQIKNVFVQATTVEGTLNGVKAIASGGNYSLIQKQDGFLWMSENYFRQFNYNIGENANENIFSPAKIFYEPIEIEPEEPSTLFKNYN